MTSVSAHSSDQDTVILEDEAAVDITPLLRVMIDRGASDLYLTVNRPPHYRIEGAITPIGERQFSVADMRTLARSMMSVQQWDNFELTQEMNFALASDELGRFRVNVFQQRGSIGMVLRKINTRIATLDELGLPTSLASLVMQKRGLILVVGATGSGKSTTLAAMIDHRNRHDAAHIVAVEDPIEFVHIHERSLVHQREVGSDTASFQAALKNAMRQAPDVILVGEIRDRSTMEAAITFADTGHLCLATLHATNAYQTFERILNFFPDTQHDQILLQLSFNLRAIISQRLVVGKNERRRAALEILLDTPRIKELIKRGEFETMTGAMEQSAREGCQTFNMALAAQYHDGVLDLDQALSNADSVNNLRIRLKADATRQGSPHKPAVPASFQLQHDDRQGPTVGRVGWRQQLRVSQSAESGVRPNIR